jgi:ribosomal protein S18 acetylase RimI-like enzyme
MKRHCKCQSQHDRPPTPPATHLPFAHPGRDAHRMAGNEAWLIRPAQAGDDATLASLVPDPDRRAWRLRNADEAHEALLVAELEGRVIGAVSIRWNRGCDAPHPWIYGGEVLPNHRNKGIGTSLWQEAHRLCRYRGARATSLDVDVTNAGARRLYERLGYVVVGPHKHHWVARDSEAAAVIAQGTADTWLMRCALPAEVE